MQIHEISLKDLKPYERNAKKHDNRQIENVAESIRQFGFAQPLVVDKDNVVIIGHCRLLASKKLGLDKVPCIRLDKLTDEQVQKLRLLDNKLNESEWDIDLLLEDIPVLDFSDFDIDWGLPEDEEKVEIVEDEAPEDAEPRCKLGDIWQLGNHRLICGDSTDVNVIERLMDGVKADIAFTSPPYNAGTTPTELAQGNDTKYNGNDDDKSEQEYRDFLNAYLHCALAVSEYAFMNVQSISNNKVALIDVLSDNKDVYADTIIWDKQHGQPAMAHNVLNSVYEYIHIFSHKANRAIGTIDFRGTIDNILHLPQQRHNEFSSIHNATFSVEFAAWFISRFAKETVLDSFGGTGTTLIACEQLNRKCYMCELDERYVSVIVQRWLNLTGRKDEIFCIRDGQKLTYDEVFDE